MASALKLIGRDATMSQEGVLNPRAGHRMDLDVPSPALVRTLGRAGSKHP